MLHDYLRRAYRTVLPLLYAKKNYKFFLLSSLFDLDQRTQRIVHATNMMSRMIKPIGMLAPFGKRVLVLAPHQDDEAIGCGGAVIAHVREGGEARVVILQDGSGAEKALGLSRDDLICRREAESSECASLLGIDEPVFLRCTKNALRDTSAVSRKLHKIIAEYKPDTIFTPSPLDNDDDHRRTSLALAHSIQGITYKIDIFSYEVWGLCIPNVVVFIDKFIDEKERLINCFKSQIQNNDYAHAFRGLAMYNSLQFGSIQSKYVERFFVLPSHEFINFTNKVLADE